MKLYRAMKAAADGRPEVGPTARALGVRGADQAPHNDLRTASAPTDRVVPGTGGMSVAPNDPGNLQLHRRPAALGGMGRDPVWEIDEADLGPELILRQDRQTHAHVEPRTEMALADYETALAATRNKWVRAIG